MSASNCSTTPPHTEYCCCGLVSDESAKAFLDAKAPKSRFRGSLDVPLNLEGWKAAINAGFHLRECGDFKLIVHDWQQRTRDTAKCVKLFFPGAELAQHGVHSQQLGWLEGRKVTEDSLNIMKHYISNPSLIPHPGCEGNLPPQSFYEWINEWFWTYDQLKRYAEEEKCRTLIVTHNRNIQAILSRKGNWVDFKRFDVHGPKPCEAVEISQYLTLLRHGDTDWGT